VQILTRVYRRLVCIFRGHFYKPTWEPINLSLFLAYGAIKTFTCARCGKQTPAVTK
jgi:hypothetical protein